MQDQKNKINQDEKEQNELNSNQSTNRSSKFINNRKISEEMGRKFLFFKDKLELSKKRFSLTNKDHRASTEQKKEISAPSQSQKSFFQKVKDFMLEKPKINFTIFGILNVLISFAVFSFFAGNAIQNLTTSSTKAVINVFEKNELEIILKENNFEINKELPYILTSLEVYQFFQKENLLKIENETTKLEEELEKNLIILNQNIIYTNVMGSRLDIPIIDITRNYGTLSINNQTLENFLFEHLDIDGIGFYILAFNFIFIVKSFDFILYFVFAVLIVPFFVWGLLKISGYDKVTFSQIQKYTLLFYSGYLVLENLFFFTVGRIDVISISMLCFFGVSIFIKSRLDQNKPL